MRHDTTHPLRSAAALAGVALAMLAAPAAAPAAAAPIAPPRIAGDPPPLTGDPRGAELAEEDRAVQLGTPAPERFAATSPVRAAAEALQAWHDRAWDRMAVWSSEPAPALRRRLAVDRLRGWAVLGHRQAAGRADVRVAVVTRGMRPDLRRDVRTVRLTRAPGGRWTLAPRAL